MLNKTKWLTICVILASVAVAFVFKRSLDKYLITFLSISLSLILTTIVAVVLLAFAFKPVTKQLIGLNISYEQYKEATNLLEISKKELEQKNKMLRQKTDTLTTLNRISKAMVSTVDLERILGLILEAVQKELNFDRIVILLINNNILEPERGIGIEESDLKKLKVSLDEKNNFVVKTIIEAKPKIFTSVEDDILPSSFTELYKNLKPNLFVSLPLISKEKVIGLLLIDTIASQKPIEERNIRELVIFTNQAGLAIDNARLFEMEKNFTDELKKQVEIAKKELEHAQIQLIKSERLSALGEMAAVVAHEVRNPMASIRASAQRISKKIPDDNPNKKYTNYIIEEADRLERVVRDILTFSRETAPQSEPNDINKLIEDILYFIQPEISSSKVNLIKALEPTISKVKIDPALIRQVLLNIIQNALNFLANSERKELKVATMQNDGHITVEISDTGPGIPEENIKKIFEPFFTTKPSGTGLGLSISNRIIEAHNGKIEVESKLKHGATFKILLPI
ncbi:MAG: ATP-binding protein [Elusimicrobia bacterium]|nr:ATP-binding protein [Elusimicrobiota bacterium]